MGRKAKSKNRKARAASTGPSADADPQRRESESSEIMDAAGGSSGASSLVEDEDERPSIVEPPTANADVRAEGEVGAAGASAADEVTSSTVDEPNADGVVPAEEPQGAVGTEEAAAEIAATTDAPAGHPATVDAVDTTEDVQAVTEEATVEVEVATEAVSEAFAPLTVEREDASVEMEAPVASAVASVVHESEAEAAAASTGTETQSATVAEAIDAADALDVNDSMPIPSDNAVVEQLDGVDAPLDAEAEVEVAAREDAVDVQLVEEEDDAADFSADVDIERDVEVSETTVESATVAAVDEDTASDVVAVSVEVPDSVEPASDEVAELGVAVEQHLTETAVSEEVAIEEHEETIVSTEEITAEQQPTDIAVADNFTAEKHHTETVTTEDEHMEQHQTETANVTVEEHLSEAVEAEEHIVEEPQAETVATDEVAAEEHHADSMKAEDAAVEELRTENVVAEDVAVEEIHMEAAVAEEEHIEEEDHAETVVVVEEKLMVEENHTETVAIDRSSEQQSAEPVDSRTEVTTAMAMEDLDVDDKAATSQSNAVIDSASVDHHQVDAQPESSEHAADDSADRKTRSRPMLTTERSFVMEDDDTVKADDTVVVSERMSTDGEDDFEDVTPLPAEGFQAAVIANSMSMMSPVLEKRHLEALASEQNGKSHRKTSSAMAPTASSTARRSSEDNTPNMTPTRVRSRSSSRHSTPDTDFVKPPPAPPTVPMLPKRASIMAPTASYAAKHQTEDDASKKTPTRTRSHSSEAKLEISDTGFIKPPPAPPTVPIPPKRASIMAPTASYAAKHQSDDAPKKTSTRVRTDKHAKPEISDTGFIKPPPAPPTVPVPPKRASIMAPTASSAKRGHGESADASLETKTPPRARRSPGAKPEVSVTGFVKPPPPPPTVPIRPKRASIMAPTASSAAKRGGPDVTVDEWSRNAPPKPATRTKATEFVPTVPVAPKRASIMAPTASFRAKSGPEVVVEELPPPPVETKPLYRNKRYANVQSKVLGMINAPAKKTEPKPAPPVEEPKRPAPVQKPTMFKSKRYANVQSKIKDIIHSGPSQSDPSAVDRRRSLGSAKRDAVADAARRRSSLAGSSTLRSANTSGSGSGSDSSDPFAQALAARAHKKKLNNAVPRYLSYENSGVYAQRAQTQQERRRRLEEQNANKSQTRQHQLRVVFAEKLHVNYNAQEAEHSQAALGNVGTRARRAGGKTRGSRSSSASDEFSAASESKPAPVAVAGGVIVLPSASANGSSTESAVESVVETSAAVETVEVDAEPQTKVDDGVTKKINFDDTSDDEEEEIAAVAAATAVPVADVA